MAGFLPLDVYVEQPHTRRLYGDILYRYVQKSESQRQPEDSSATRCRFGHLARGMCMCAHVCTPITPMNYYYYYYLRTTKLDEPGTGAMSPEANFAKRIYTHITIIIIIYYTRNLCTVYAHTYDTPVCVCVCALEYNT